MTGWRPRLDYGVYRLADFVARHAPESQLERSARFLGRIFLSVMRGRRAMVARHARRVGGPDLAGPALDERVQAVFNSYARYWIASFRLPSASQEEVEARFSIEGFEHVEAARRAGTGAIIVMPHLGSWEIGGRWMSSQGVPVSTVVEPLDPPELFEWFADLRGRLGMMVVPLNRSAGAALLRALRANGVLALLCDRDIGGSGVPVEFFGETTTLPGGPATLALRTRAPILPAAIYDRGAGRHHAVICPPIPTDRQGKVRDDVARVTQSMAVALEGLIRRAPDQWHLVQPNWPSDLLP